MRGDMYIWPLSGNFVQLNIDGAVLSEYVYVRI